jgi:PGF-pre-PGF domain-containing protein/PGF-CTERM protein
MVASVFATVNVAALGFVGTAEAAPGDPATFSVTQNGECFEVQSFGDGTESVEDFYDYRPTSSGKYSSHGTTEFQQDDTTQMFLYNGSQGVSLVVVHDRLDGDDTGGVVTFNVTGVPTGSEWAVRDDYYTNSDGEKASTNYDNFSVGDSSAHADWFWVDDRTDGGALRAPQGAEFSMTVEPAFNGDAHHNHPDGRYNGGTVDTWNVRSPDGGAATELDMSQPVTIETGGCGSAPEADLNASPQDVTVGETVTFDASNSTDADGDIAEYRWDFDGDGQVDRSTTEATTEFAYDAADEYTAAVTVVDSEDRTDTATATVSVSESLTARADVPSSVGVNETFTADGSNSTGEIASYEWDFGDGTTATGASVDHAYGETGTYEVTLTVTDSAGNEDTDTTTVEVVEGSEDAGPSAHLDASPSSAAVGETVAFDASGSSDDDGIDSYEWDFDGDGTVDRTTESATTEKSYGSAGEYAATVTVVDTAGQTDTAKQTVTVEKDDDDGGDDAPPTAAVTAPETVVVNDTFEIDASASTDDDGIVEYRWDFNDDGKIDRTTTEATTIKVYDRPKTFTTEVTVVDASEQTDSASVTIEATEPDDDAPSADLHAPEKVHVGDEFDVNVTNVHDESGVAHVHWYFDGEKGPDGHRATVSFDESGTHTVTVLLRDEEGNERTMSTQVEVVAKDEGDDSGGGDGGDGSDDNDGGNTGGSAGGNTGGYTGDTDGGDSSDESSMETSVDVTDDDVIEIAVTDAESGDRATMTFPVENETESTTFDGMAATFDAAGDYDMTVESSADAPENVTAPTVEDDGFAPQAFLTVDHPNVSDEDLRSASISFSVERSALNRTDAETDDVSLFRATNGSWERVDVEYVGQNDSAHEFRANLTELSTFAAGVDRPAMAVTDVTVDDTDVKAGDVIEVTATVANDGRADGTVRADLTVDGSVVATENVSLPAGATTTVSFDHELSSAGTMTVGVNGETTDLSVASVQTDESDDDATESTTVASDDSGASDDSEDPDESNSLGQPGMGVGVALVALLCASLLALRRRD